MPSRTALDANALRLQQNAATYLLGALFDYHARNFARLSFIAT